METPCRDEFSRALRAAWLRTRNRSAGQIARRLTCDGHPVARNTIHRYLTDRALPSINGLTLLVRGLNMNEDEALELRRLWILARRERDLLG